MPTAPNHPIRRCLTLGLSVGLVFGCSSKSGGGSGEAAPSPAAPETVNTIVTGSSVTGMSATVRFRSDLPGAKFKCQLTSSGKADPTAWKDCPGGTLTVTLAAGQTYTFLVKAYDPATLIEDGQPARVPLTAGGSAPVTAAQVAGIPPGVAAPTNAHAPAGTTTAAAGAAARPAAPLVETFQLGSFYDYVLPKDVHVTEYATNKTASGQEAYYRVSPQSDPYYLGNYACNGDTDSQLSAPAPDRTTFAYCLTTPPGGDIFKFLTDYRVANNHLEVATNPQDVTSEHHDYIDFNVFDADFEYMQNRSRFEQLCADRQGAIYVTPLIKLIKADEYGGKLKAVLYICSATLVMPDGPGLPLRDPTLWRNNWWIGAFFVTRTVLDLPQPECVASGPVVQLPAAPAGNDTYGPPQAPGATYVPDLTGCGPYVNPSLVEVTFVTNTPYPSPEEFAAQIVPSIKSFMQQITSIGPN